MSDLAPQGRPEDPLLGVGDIVVSRSWVVTPSGTCQLVDAEVDSIVQTITYRRTPTWAVVVAVLFIFSVVSLLFLFVKEDRINGNILVTVEGPTFTHTSTVRVYGFAQVSAVQRDVAQVESLIDKAKLRSYGTTEHR